MRSGLSLVSSAALFLASATVLPAQPAAPRLDNYGDPLPPGAVLRLGTTRLQTGSGFSRAGFAWGPEGKSLVTMKHGTVYFWDMSDGHCRETLLVPIDANYGTGLGLSKDGKRLVCSDRLGTIASWNLETSELTERKRVEPRSESEHLEMALSPDGATVVTCGGGLPRLDLWDAATCQLKRSVKLADSPDSRLLFSPSGDALVFVRGEALYSYDMSNEGEPIKTPLPARSRASSLAFAPNGRTLIASLAVRTDDPVMKKPQRRWDLAMFDVTKRELIAQWPVDPAIPPGCSVAVTPDGTSLVTVHPDRVLIWNLNRKTVERSIEGLHFWNAMSVQVEIDPTGKYLAINDRDKYVRLWNLATGQPHLSTHVSHADSVSAAAWSPDGSTIATGTTGIEPIRLWSAATGKVIGLLDKEARLVRDLVYSKDGSQIIVFCNQTGLDAGNGSAVLRWHDARTGQLAREHRLEGKAWRFAVSPDESQVALETFQPDALVGEGDATLQIIESASGKAVSSIETPAISTATMAWAPTGKSIYFATSTDLVQMEVAAGKILLKKALPHFRRDRQTGALGPTRIWRSAFFKDAHAVLTTGGLPELHAWSTVTGEKRWSLPVGKHFIRGLALSPDESVIACIDAVGDTDAKTMRLFQIGNHRELAHFDLGRENCDRLVFSPDGNRIAVGFYDGTALVYDVSAAWNKVE